MLKIFSFFLIQFLVIAIQSSAITFGIEFYLALHLILFVILIVFYERLPILNIAILGLFIDFLLFRILGFSSILFLLIYFLCGMIKPLFDFSESLGQFLLMLFLLYISFLIESLMFVIFTGTYFDFWYVSTSYLLNIPLFIVFTFFFLFLKKSIFYDVEFD